MPSQLYQNRGGISLGLQKRMAISLDSQVDQGDTAIEQRYFAAKQRARLLKQSRLAVMVLESLDEQGRTAYVQRTGMLAGLVQIREAVKEMDIDLTAGAEQIASRIEIVGGRISAEMAAQTSLLDGIVRLENLGLEETRQQTDLLRANLDELQEQNRQLEFIGDGIVQLVDLSQQGNQLLQDIAHGVAATNEAVSKVSHQLDHIGIGMDLFIMIGNKMKKQLVQVIGVLKTPIEQKAHNLWEIGERCRQAGDISAAFRKLRESYDEDPSKPEMYYSLAMVCLELGAIESARDFFSAGLHYAKDNRELRAQLLLQMGKLAYISEQYMEAKKYLEQALSSDSKNIDVWYELALVELKLGNESKAVYYLRNLVVVAKKKAPAYIKKVLNDPDFSGILHHLTI